MTTPADAARAKIAELQAEIEKLHGFLRLYETFEAEAKGAAMAKRARAGRAVSQGDAREVILRPARSDSLPSIIADETDRILNDANRPLNRREIVDELERRGIEIPYPDKMRYVGTIIWRHKDRFVGVKDGYWLRDRLQDVPGVEPGTPYHDPPNDEQEPNRAAESDLLS